MEGSSKRRKRSLGDEEEDSVSPLKLDEGATEVGVATLSNKDRLMQALEEVQCVNERAIAICKNASDAIDHNYHLGLRSFEDHLLTNIRTLIDSSTAEVNYLVGIVHDKAQGAPIYKLPPEIISMIFIQLNSDDLLKCQSVCRLWKTLLDRKETWEAAQSILNGTPMEIDAKWKRLQKNAPRPSSIALSVSGNFSVSKVGEDFRKIGLIKNIPFFWLFNLQCEVASYSAATSVWFNCVSRCTRLKCLNWSARCSRDYRQMCRLDIRHALLSSCRLEELIFDAHYDIVIDTAFVQILSQVKRLHHFGGLGRSHLVAILSEAEEDLEELIISGLGSCEDWQDQEPSFIKDAFNMSKLRSISLEDVNLGSLSITAPRAEEVCFKDGNLVDTTLLNSCRHQLKSLRIDMAGVSTKEKLDGELFNMPNLQNLELSYGGQRNIACYDVYSTSTLWSAVSSNDITTMRFVLPVLKDLSICHDPMLSESIIVKYMEIRSFLGQPALEKVSIDFANHHFCNTEALEKLQTTLPGFSYRQFEDWEENDTRPWGLLTTLSYVQSNTVDWHTIDVCRRDLKVLRICTRDEDHRLKYELFNMPRLEDLELYFEEGPCGYASAASLWNVFLHGSTGQKGILPQDIMPNLKRLWIHKDSLLDEDRIIKFVEMRESLGLASLEELTVHLTRSHSEGTARLKALKEKMPNFEYFVEEQALMEFPHTTFPS